MAWQYPLSKTSSSITIKLGELDSVYVARQVAITATGNYYGTGAAILGTGSNHYVAVEGTVAGPTAIKVGDSATKDYSQFVEIWEDGRVVSGDGYGVVVNGTTSQVDNMGQITAGIYGIQLNAQATTGFSEINNTGIIKARSAAISATTSTQEIHFTNSGTLQGNATAYDGGKGIDKVVNYGMISGSVLLGGGNDFYDGRSGHLKGLLVGGAGDDKAYGGVDAEQMRGGIGNDQLFGYGGNDKLWGEDGNDIVNGGSGNDTLDGGNGDDTLVGETGADTLIGGAGIDAVSYNTSTKGVVANLAKPSLNTNDAKGDTYSSIENLTGSYYADILTGTSGANGLAGGYGNDKLTGGLGADTFIFDSKLGSGNVDVITDFSVKDDTIWLNDFIFTKAGKPGDLSVDAFYTGTKAHDATDRVIYDKATGNIWYDADGNGKGVAVHFATVTKGLALTAHDFDIV